MGIVIMILVAIGVYLPRTLKREGDGQINEGVGEVRTETSMAKPVMEKDYVTWVAKLEDVFGGNSKGTGYILRDGKVLYHKVTAELPDPEGSDFYEGWLVQQTPVLKFFSTGEMVEESDGNYSLSYESETQYENYNFVVITLETVRDAVPEKHILEGLSKIEEK